MLLNLRLYLHQPLNTCLLRWKRVLVLLTAIQLEAATSTYHDLLICFQNLMGAFVGKVAHALYKQSYKSPSKCPLHKKWVHSPQLLSITLYNG